MQILHKDTICAPATVQGKSAIAVIRVSGPDAIEVTDRIFNPAKSPCLAETKGNRVRFGSVLKDGEVLDEVLVTVYRTPHSFTGEDSIEIACHGSVYIQQEIIALLIKNGVRLANPGEFSQRAFLNGKMDLAQAEAVADLIASESRAAHKIAMRQMKGGFSKELGQMRSELLEIVSLMELELDFSDEDVEFADRVRLSSLTSSIIAHINRLIESFRLGNAIRNGVPVAIAGATNTGKSTLLNALLGEERAIVSDIHGTTRDFIEDTINIDGISFRFTDTAGIRVTSEKIEQMGIERTFAKIGSSSVILLVLDAERISEFENNMADVADVVKSSEADLIILINKCDNLNHFDQVLSSEEGSVGVQSKEIDEIRENIETISHNYGLSPTSVIFISARKKIGINRIKEALVKLRMGADVDLNSTLVSNIRHLEALTQASEALMRVSDGLSAGIPTDLISQDIREAMFHLGEITGEINTEEILGNIFSKFCIGK